MCTYITLHPSSMSLAFSGDALKMLEAKGQSHYHSRAGPITMPYSAIITGCWRPDYDRWPDHGVEVRAPGTQ